MLKIDPQAKQLTPLAETTLQQASIFERYDLQEAIVRSWGAFCGEVGFEELFLVGKEIVPHDSCGDRIDILALGRDGVPVVFELKRHRDRLHLLQAIAYAAMVARWDAQRFLREIRPGSEEADELASLLRDGTFPLRTPKIVLIAESFDPEVVLAANWLSSFGVDISAFAVSALQHGGDVLLSIDQRFPVAGVDDVYERRATRAAPQPGQDATWEEVLEKVNFDFARRAVEIFRRRIEGSPARRDFASIYASSPLGRMGIAFRRNYLKVYTNDQSPEAEQILRDRLGPAIPIQTWGSDKTQNSGFTFKIETEEQFERFLYAVGEKSTAP